MSTYERGLSVNVGLKASTSYTVTFAAGATDRYGQAMGGYRWSFTTGALEPSVSLALPAYLPMSTYSASAEPILYFQTTNLPTVAFTLYPLTADQARSMLHDYSAAANRAFAPTQPALRKWTETVSGPKDEVLLGKTSLSLDGHSPLPKGYYFLHTDGQNRSQFAFAVVDTVLVTKLSTDELLIWAVDHETGAPVGGLTVRGEGPGIQPAARSSSRAAWTSKVNLGKIDE